MADSKFWEISEIYLTVVNQTHYSNTKQMSRLKYKPSSGKKTDRSVREIKRQKFLCNHFCKQIVGQTLGRLLQTLRAQILLTLIIVALVEKSVG